MNATDATDTLEPADCGYGCKTMLVAMDRLTSHVCDSKETTMRTTIVFLVILLIQFVALTGVCIYAMRHSYLRHYLRRDESKKKLVSKSDLVVADMDDAEI